MVNYNLDIPDGPNNPSNDQPKMKINTNAVQQILEVDHVGFNTNGSAPNGVGGHHLQVSFDGKNVPGAQTDPQSVLYTDVGTASSVAELYFRNALGTSGKLLISCIKAFGKFTKISSGGPFPVAVTLENGYNVVTINKTAATTYVVDLTPGIIVGTNVVVLSSNAYSYAVDTLTLTITSTSFSDVNFAILQA